MSTMDLAAVEDLQFPAFLSRSHQPPAPVGGVPCNGIKARARDLWGAAARFLRLLLWPVLQPREVSFVEIEDMSRNGGMLAGPGGGHPAPTMPVLEDGIMKAAISALDTFRAVEGEKALNMLLHELLLKSNENLARYGVRGAFRETAELESLRAQLARQQELNKRGSAEHRHLQHAANEAMQAMSVIAGGADDANIIAREAMQNWETATNPPNVQGPAH
jgi:hypothetical protein